jgi:hypothetical protein
MACHPCRIDILNHRTTTLLTDIQDKPRLYPYELKKVTFLNYKITYSATLVFLKVSYWFGSFNTNL